MGSSKGNAAFSKGDCVIYKCNGICRISEIQKRDFAGEKRDYYVLQSLYDGHSTWYVPVDSVELVGAMSRVLSVDEVNSLIDDSRESEDVWEDDFKKRSEKFSGIVRSGDRAQVMSLLKTLSLRKKDAEARRSKLYVSDEKVLHSVEKMITEEFSYVLGIPRGEVMSYIADRLEA